MGRLYCSGMILILPGLMQMSWPVLSRFSCSHMRRVLQRLSSLSMGHDGFLQSCAAPHGKPPLFLYSLSNRS